MINIVTVCGAGVGSSMMLRLFAQQILDAEDIEATVDASDIGSVDPSAYDLIITLQILQTHCAMLQRRLFVSTT